MTYPLSKLWKAGYVLRQGADYCISFSYKIAAESQIDFKALVFYNEHRTKKEGAIMERMKKNFGFGCMRLPMKDGQVDTAEMNQMVDAFLDSGFNYFDTAHGYLDGKSETALRESLTSRYPRAS